MINPTVKKGGKVNAYKGNVRPAIVLTVAIIVIHIVVAAILVNQVNAAFWLVNIILFVFYALLFGMMAFQATQIQIVVYEKGIDWQRSSSHTFTTWENIDKIGRNNEGDATSYGLYLRERVQPDGHSWLDKRLFSPPVDYIRLIPTIKIPTAFKGMEGNVIDMQALAETDFGKDVLRYAPHLLEK